jgi:hypothetical protein
MFFVACRCFGPGRGMFEARVCPRGEHGQASAPVAHRGSPRGGVTPHSGGRKMLHHKGSKTRRRESREQSTRIAIVRAFRGFDDQSRPSPLSVLLPSCLCVFVVNSLSRRERKSLTRFETQSRRGTEGTENCSPLLLRVLCASATLRFSLLPTPIARSPSGRVARGRSLVCRARPSNCGWRFGFHHKGTKTQSKEGRDAVTLGRIAKRRHDETRS